MTKANIAVLVSGGGTNLQAILDAQEAGSLKSGQVVLVVSDRAGAYALERARKAGVPGKEINKKACGGQAAFEAQLEAALADPATYSDSVKAAELSRAYQEKKAEVEQLYQRWEALMA